MKKHIREFRIRYIRFLYQLVDPCGLDGKFRRGPVLLSFFFTLSLHPKFDRSVESDSSFLRYDSRPSHINPVKKALV